MVRKEPVILEYIYIKMIGENEIGYVAAAEK